MSYVKVLEWKDGECERDKGRGRKEMSAEWWGGKEVCGKEGDEKGEEGEEPEDGGVREGGGRK